MSQGLQAEQPEEDLEVIRSLELGCLDHLPADAAFFSLGIQIGEPVPPKFRLGLDGRGVLSEPAVAVLPLDPFDSMFRSRRRSLR